MQAGYLLQKLPEKLLVFRQLPCPGQLPSQAETRHCTPRNQSLPLYSHVLTLKARACDLVLTNKDP